MKMVIFNWLLASCVILLLCFSELCNGLSLSAFLYDPFRLRWELMNITNTNYCNLSKTKSNLTGNSTKRDVIITSAFKRIDGSLPFVMSLRATDCKASLVIFAGIEIKGFTEYVSEIESYGCQFIYTYMDISLRKDIFYYRHHLYYQFYMHNKENIDRVLQIDLFDTIFQHDPFIADGKSLILSNECLKLSTHKWSQNLIKECINKLDKIIPYKGDPKALYNKIIGNNHLIVNGGTQYGSIDIMLELENTMKRIGKGKKAYADDQACLQTFVYMNYFNFSIIFDRGNLGYLSSIAPYWSRGLRGELGNIIISGNIPAVVHQYDRHKFIKKQIHERCPNLKNFKKFTR